jgi:hypothetical protein
LAAGDETLIALVGRLASIDRAARPRSASEVSDALRTWLAGHHPLGVDAELAERAVRARAQRLATPPPPSDLPAASSGRIEVRSLAVSPALTELLQQATERIERPSLSHDAAAGASSPPLPETLPDNIGDDPELHRIARRLFRDFVVLSVALIAALLYAQRYPHRDPPVPDDPPPPLAAKSNAVVPTAPAEPIAPPPPSAAGAPSPTPSAADTAKPPGFLTVSASPWAEIHVDGRALGVTPRRNLSLRPGRHMLTLICPPLDREAKLSIDLQPGQSLRVVANLQEAPAKVSVQ